MGTGAVGLAFASQTATIGWRWAMWIAIAFRPQAAALAEVPGFGSVTAGVVVSAMGIGFGLWWAGFAAIELQRIRRAGGPPLHPGWWGFVFPMAAMTISISALGTVSEVWLLQAVGLLATFALTGLWIYIAAVTAPLTKHRPMVAERAMSD